MKLGKNIIKLCIDRGWNLSELSRRAEIPQPTLHGWTTGRSVQDLNDLRKICSALEVSLHELVFDEVDPFQISSNTFKELFTGDIRITIHRAMSNSQRDN